MNGQRHWPELRVIYSKYPFFTGQAPVSMKLLFISENGFWTNAIEIPNILYCYVPKVNFVSCYIFFFLSAVAHINVALVSCEKSLKTVTDERDFHHTSVSTVVRFIISSSIAPHKIFFIQTGLKSFSPVDSQDIFHPDRFYSLPPKWIHKIFFIQRGLKSSFPMDSQDLVQCSF